MKFLLILLTFLFILFGNQAYSQGCSDAGVCSVGALGLAQYKYEKLPIDKVKLDLIEVEDTEVLNADFNPRSKQVSLIIITEPNVVGKVSVVCGVKNQEIIAYNIDSIKANSNLRKDLLLKSPRFIFNYLISYGSGDNKTSIITNNLEINYRLINKKMYAQLKVPYIGISGNLGDTKGLGDLTFSLSYTAIRKKKKSLNLVAGVKIPTTESNFSSNNKPLPMAYQTSLGSRDALVGVNYRYQKWDFTLAYQHSFNSNNNQYLHNPFYNETYNSYFESKKLKRADDGVFRINRSFLFKKGTITSGLLFIYHIENDTYINNGGERQALNGSQGLTLNFNAAVIYPVAKKIDCTFIFASPFVTRDSRPDGLTRAYVVMGGLRYSLH